MSNQDMITAIIAAIQTDSNVIILLRALITANVTVVDTPHLQAMCAALGINTNG